MSPLDRPRSAAYLTGRLNHLAGRAIHEFALIESENRLLVGVSGGKDSLLLVHWLAELKRRAPVRFSLGVAHLALTENDALRSWLNTLDLEYIHWEKSPFDPSQEIPRDGSAPCFICSRRRRSRLFELAREYRADRLVLGHHLDDARETLLLNLFFNGRLEAMRPRQDLFRGTLALIRPFYLVPESLVSALTRRRNLPVRPSSCPFDGHTQRQAMKEMVAGLAEKNAAVPGNLTRALRKILEL